MEQCYNTCPPAVWALGGVVVVQRLLKLILSASEIGGSFLIKLSYRAGRERMG